MKYYYSLRIETEDNMKDDIDRILGVTNNMADVDWGLEIFPDENNMGFDFIDYFTGILRNKFDKLESIGVLRENISIWMLYEYDEQCNMEFRPEQLIKIGAEKITLCISCWES